MIDAQHYVTLPQLEALIERVEGRIVDGFSGVHHRQDITNGRVNKSEVVNGQHAVLLEDVRERLRGVEHSASVASHAAALAAGKAEAAAAEASKAASNAAKAASTASKPYAFAAKIGTVGGGSVIALYELWQRLLPWLAGLK